jgi:translation initiation factor 2 beta subunit (eIF-2beta)/eIF-5
MAKKELQLQIVNWEVEESVSLMIDGQLVLNGNKRHDKVEHQIEGFIAALNFLKVKHTIEKTTEEKYYEGRTDIIRDGEAG